MKKEYIKQHGREFMVNGIRKMVFLELYYYAR